MNNRTLSKKAFDFFLEVLTNFVYPTTNSKKDEIFLFPIDTLIALQNKRVFGYGVRPIGVVKGYAEGGKYVILMESDKNGDFFAWINGLYYPNGNRISQEEIYPSYQIETNFKKIERSDPALVYDVTEQ